MPGTGGPVFEQVGDLVYEARSVADALADRPPVARVGMARVLGADPTHAVERGVVRGRGVPELVEAGVVEDERPGAPVHLNREVDRPAHAASRQLDHAARAGGEAEQT